MSTVRHFINTVEYLARGHPEQLQQLKVDLCRDLRTFFAYIEELEAPVDRPGVSEELEAQDDQSFSAMLDKYRDIIRDIELGNLRREASAIRREGQLNELFSQLCSNPQEEVA